MLTNGFIKLKETLFALSHKEVRIIISFLIIITAVWAFVEIADEVNEGATRQFDEMILKSLRNA